MTLRPTLILNGKALPFVIFFGAQRASVLGCARRVLSIAAAAVLASCGGSGDAADGYQFGAKEFDRGRPNITVIMHPTLTDLRAKAPASAKRGERKLMAWGIIRPDGCEIHIVDPAVSYQPEWIGHEVAHCAWGRWHR